jgi:restriction system protein
LTPSGYHIRARIHGGVIPDYQTLMLPVLWLAAQGETRAPELEERLADELGLTSDERNQLLPGPRSR